MKRINSNTISISNPYGLDIQLFANVDVPIDKHSVDEIRKFSSIVETIDTLKSIGYLSDLSYLKRVVLTPDFHKSSGIPVGTVLDATDFVCPKAVGSDIGCGMQFTVTDVTEDEYATLGKSFEEKLRYIFFEGGRNIALSPKQRKAIFLYGMAGLSTTPHSAEGIWKYWDDYEQEVNSTRYHAQCGCYPSDGQLWEFSDFINGSGNGFTRDDQIGSIGGGNHFVELQKVEEIFDPSIAYDFGIKKNALCIMTHSGSVSIGSYVGKRFQDLAKSMYPKGLKHPEHGFYMFPARSDAGRKYMSAMNQASNFATVNRTFLNLMLIRAMSECLGRNISFRLVYDAPHNLIWGRNESYIHRKGACPAYGPTNDTYPYGHPVIIPGSMGDSSYIMCGTGSEDSLKSACHGAGRVASRKTTKSKEKAELSTLRVITKVDPSILRADVYNSVYGTLLEEAPSAYKSITPVIQTIADAFIASRVARTLPLLTLKGI